MREREDYDNAVEYVQDRLRQRRQRRLLIAALILAVLAGGFAAWLNYYKVRYVTVEGATRYTDAEIEDYAMSGFLGDNSVVLSWRYQNQTLEDIPFVESMDIQITAHDTIHITVYEKSLAGYVMYLGRYMYFDRSGMVVESTTELAEGVPEVTGLSFDHIVVNEVLPVQDTDIFTRILQTTQLLEKYDLTADRIYVGTTDEISVYFDEICVKLGEDENMDEKISNLSRILPSLEGMSGTLELSDFTSDTNYVTFTEK